jgi:hypothetical protein
MHILMSPLHPRFPPEFTHVSQDAVGHFCKSRLRTVLIHDSFKVSMISVDIFVRLGSEPVMHSSYSLFWLSVSGSFSQALAPY